MPHGCDLVAGDNDFHVVNLTPSVTLLTEVKENPDGNGGLPSLYKGVLNILCYLCNALTTNTIGRVRVLFSFRDCPRVLERLYFPGIIFYQTHNRASEVAKEEVS